MQTTLSQATIEAIDDACAADPACHSNAMPKLATAGMPTSIGTLLASILPFFGTWGQTALALLPLLQEALAALQAAGNTNPDPATVVAKAHEIAGCR